MGSTLDMAPWPPSAPSSSLSSNSSTCGIRIGIRGACCAACSSLVDGACSTTLRWKPRCRRRASSASRRRRARAASWPSDSVSVRGARDPQPMQCAGLGGVTHQLRRLLRVVRREGHWVDALFVQGRWLECLPLGDVDPPLKVKVTHEFKGRDDLRVHSRVHAVPVGLEASFRDFPRYLANSLLFRDPAPRIDRIHCCDTEV